MVNPVTIELDLDAGGVYNELAQVEVLLKSLKQDFGDLGVDLGDGISSAADDVQKLVSELEEVEDQMNRISKGMSNAAGEMGDIDLNPSTGSSGGDGGGPNTVKAQTMFDGSGNRTMIPGLGDGEDFDPYATAQRINRRFGFEKDTITGTDLAGMTIDRLNASIAEFYFDKEGIDGVRRNLGASTLPSGWTLDPNGRFFGKSGMEFQTLREKLEKGDRRASLRGAGANLIPDMDLRRAELIERGKDNIDSLQESFAGLGQRLRRLKPTMQAWWQLLALMLPLMISFGVQAVGVAAALGGVAVAGASLIGLGLIGHADSMAASFEQAKYQVRDLKEDLFNVFQPTAQMFAPIQAQMFDQIPGMLNGVASEMQGLVVYEDTLYRMFNIGATFAEQFLGLVVQNADAISQLAERFGAIGADSIIDLFGWLVNEASNNQQTLIALGEALKNIALIIYNVSKAVGHIVAKLGPLLGILLGVTNLLNNQAILAIVTFTTFALGLGYALSKLTLALTGFLLRMQLLGNGSVMAGMVSFFTRFHAMITGAIVKLTALQGAAAKTAAALAMTGIGAVAVLGGAAVAGAIMADNPASSGTMPQGYSGGAQTVNNYNSMTIENYGNMDTASEQRIRSEISKHNGETSAMSPASPGYGANSSGGGN